MLLSAARNNKGFTLVEVLIAMLILLLGSLAIANVAVTVIDTNMGNLLRDEAVRIGDMRINGQLVDTTNTTWPALANLTTIQLSALAAAAAPSAPITVTGSSRGVQRTYTVVWQVARPVATSNVFRVDVWVGWNYKGGNAAGMVPTGQAFQHGSSTIITKLQ
jgi:prepilin-type N-terminal cleavage/methylation domain-containing protein